MPPIPKTIGRYEILELVGRGGMGVLYRARDAMLERDVALKMMLVDFTLDQGARGRFEREAKAVARLQHRNIVTIHELGEVDGAPYIVMEFLGGKDLDTILRLGKPLTLGEKLDIAIQLCEGLAYAHEQGIVHRDIKPANVRVLDDGTVKILDFGIARFAQTTVTQSNTVMGTPSYMAPEQVVGKPVDGRADLFSAGVLLFELFIGKKPFVGESATSVVYQIVHVEPPKLREAAPQLPEALDAIVSRALQKNADERYSKASEMVADLQVVKMMTDPTLRIERASPDAPTATLGKLHATTIGTKLSTGTLNRTVQPTGAIADAPPRVTSAMIGAGAGALVVALALGGYFLFRNPTPGSGSTTPGEPSTAAGAPAVAGTGGRAASAAPSAGASGGASSGPASPTPAPTVPVPAGSVFVASVPGGARIVLNGTDTGQVTPSAVALGHTIPAAIQLTLKGYQPFTGKLTDADLKAGSREFRLAREAGPVHLTASGSFPFEIVQGGKVLSASAAKHDLTVPPGGGAITARNPDFLLSMTLPVDFQRGQADVTVPAPGTLAVFSAVETCRIVADDVDLGFPPISGKRVAAGSHVVTLKCPDGKEDRRTVTVVSGERIQVTFGPPKS